MGFSHLLYFRCFYYFYIFVSSSMTWNYIAECECPVKCICADGLGCGWNELFPCVHVCDLSSKVGANTVSWKCVRIAPSFFSVQNADNHCQEVIIFLSSNCNFRDGTQYLICFWISVLPTSPLVKSHTIFSLSLLFWLFLFISNMYNYYNVQQ